MNNSSYTYLGDLLEKPDKSDVPESFQFGRVKFHFEPVVEILHLKRGGSDHVEPLAIPEKESPGGVLGQGDKQDQTAIFSAGDWSVYRTYQTYAGC